MAITQYYVDFTNGNDSTGNGTSGTPWKTTQKALNTITQGAAGDQINIAATSDDVLGAMLTLATYGTPTSAKPLIFSGYTSAANDGGIGGISGNSGGFTILTSAAVGITFKDMHLHHCGASAILNLTGTSSQCQHCELDHSTSGTAISCVTLNNCYLHDLTSGNGVSVTNMNNCYCDFRTGTPSTTALIVQNEITDTAVLLNSATACNGIRLSTGCICERNSVYGNAGTGNGIFDNGTNNTYVVDNIVEGFSGAGGKGYNFTGIVFLRAGNLAFNNTTEFTFGVVIQDKGTDVTSVATNFNSASTGDLTLASGSAAKSTTTVPATFPGTYNGTALKSYGDKGAFQSAPPAAGGLMLNPGFAGGFRG